MDFVAKKSCACGLCDVCDTFGTSGLYFPEVHTKDEQHDERSRLSLQVFWWASKHRTSLVRLGLCIGLLHITYRDFEDGKYGCDAKQNALGNSNNGSGVC